MKEFAEFVKENIKKHLPDEYKNAVVEIHNVERDNGVTQTGIIIRKNVENNGTHMTPIIYLEPFLEAFDNHVITKEKILTAIAEIQIKYDFENAPDPVKEFMEKSEKYENIKECLQFRLFDPDLTDKRTDQMQLVAAPAGALAKTCVMRLDDNNGNLFGYCTVSKELLETWGITQEQLFADTLKIEEEKGYILFDPSEKIISMYVTNIAHAATNYEITNFFETKDTHGSTMLGLSTKFQELGASAMANPKVLKDVADILKSDFYVLPATADYVLILPTTEEQNVNKIKALVASINQAMVTGPTMATELFLSNKIHMYDRKREALLLI